MECLPENCKPKSNHSSLTPPFPRHFVTAPRNVIKGAWRGKSIFTFSTPCGLWIKLETRSWGIGSTQAQPLPTGPAKMTSGTEMGTASGWSQEGLLMEVFVWSSVSFCHICITILTLVVFDLFFILYSPSSGYWTGQNGIHNWQNCSSRAWLRTIDLKFTGYRGQSFEYSLLVRYSKLITCLVVSSSDRLLFQMLEMRIPLFLDKLQNVCPCVSCLQKGKFMAEPLPPSVVFIQLCTTPFFQLLKQCF